MRDKFLVVVFAFLLTASSEGVIGQTQFEIKNLIAKRDFAALKSFSDSLYPEKKIFAYWKTSRDLTDSFQEAVLYFHSNLMGEIGDQYEARFIVKNNSISYGSILKVNKEPYDTFYVFKDEVTFRQLKSSFRIIFKADLNEKELFMTNLPFAYLFGICDSPPSEKQQISALFKRQDVDGIISWLKSPNSEKQVYAIEALWFLKAIGMPFDNETLELIKFIKNKKGTISVCATDEIFHKDIRKITEEYSFN